MFGIRLLKPDEKGLNEPSSKAGVSQKTHGDRDTLYSLCALEDWGGKVFWVFVEDPSWAAWQSHGCLWKSFWGGLKLEDLPRVQNFLQDLLPRIGANQRVCFFGNRGPVAQCHFFNEEEMAPLSNDPAFAGNGQYPLPSLPAPPSPLGSWSKEELEIAIKDIPLALRWTKKDPYPLSSIKERAKTLNLPKQPEGFACLLKGPDHPWVIVSHANWRTFRNTNPSLRLVWRLYKSDGLTKIAENFSRGLLKTRNGGITVIMEDEDFKKVWHWVPTLDREEARQLASAQYPTFTLRTTLSKFDFEGCIESLATPTVFDPQNPEQTWGQDFGDETNTGHRSYSSSPAYVSRRKREGLDIEGFRSGQDSLYLARPEPEDYDDIRELLIARLPEGAKEEEALTDPLLFSTYARKSIACWKNSQKVLHALKFGSVIIDDGTESGRLGALKLAQFD